MLLDPFVDRTVSQHVSKTRHVKNGWILAAGCTSFVGVVAFGAKWHWLDMGVLLVARWCQSCLHFRTLSTGIETAGLTGILSLVESNPVINTHHRNSNAYTSGSDKPSQLNVLETCDLLWRRLKSIVKTILKNDDSRRIFYFLCLNFGYMGIQMMFVRVASCARNGLTFIRWGIWTNSLGLISDCELCAST